MAARPSQTLGEGSQTLGAGRRTPIAPPAGRSPSLSSHSFLPTTPHRGNRYLDYVSALRFPNSGKRTPNRPLSIPAKRRLTYSNMYSTAQGSNGSEDSGPHTPSHHLTMPATPRLAFANLCITAQGSGYMSDNSNSDSDDNGGVSTTLDSHNTGGATTGVNFHNTARASTGANSPGSGGVSVYIESQDNGDASMNDNTHTIAGAVMNVPQDDEQGAPGDIQLPVNRQFATGQRFAPHPIHGGRGLRRMNSTPVLASRPMYNPTPGVGPVHTPMHMPSHPAPTAPAGAAPIVDAVTDEINEFLNTLKLMILEAVQVNRYKNGLFVTSITPRTDLIHDMNIMINSAQVTGLDNMRLQNVRAAVEEIKRRVAAGDKISMTIGDKKLTVYDFYGMNVDELRDILLSRDKHEHARWLQYYGGGNNDNDGSNGASGSAVA